MSDVDLDKPDERGVQKFFPQPDSADECGTIGAWAWGLQRAVDYLVTRPDIDPRRIVVTGHSRTGKAALLAAAFDERIAMALPHQAGCGGTAPSRARIAIGKPYNTLDAPNRRQPETVKNINDAFPHWFNARFKEFNSQPERLPFDQNCVVALCAPRPVLFSNGRADTWINPAGQFEVLRATAPVYRLLGAGDFTAEELPPDGQLPNGVLGYHLRPGGHELLREDWKVFLDFADKHLGSPSSDKATARSGAPVGVRKSTAPAGPIIIDPDYPHSFRYTSGERFFPMGDTVYSLIAHPKDVIAHYIDVRRAHKFNFMRMLAMTDGFWAFGGTPQNPDYATINEAAMEKLDWVFDYAASKGMNIELTAFGWWKPGVAGIWANSEHQNLWIDTLAKRYKDRPNLLMYIVTTEFERYPKDDYAYSPSDVEWAKQLAARIRSKDKVHAIGVQPSTWVTDDKPFHTYKGFTQRRPQVVWPLWEDSAVNLNITQNNEGVQKRSWGNTDDNHRGVTYYPTTWEGTDYPAKWTATGWDMDGAGMEDCIAADWAHGKPILNTEFGFQYEPGYESSFDITSRQTHQPSTVRKKAWRIAAAGGYFAAGFIGTAVLHFSFDDVDNFRPGQFETLYDFFTTKTEYWKMAPHLELVADQNALLALPGREYVAYFPHGGINAIKLAAGSYAVEWLRAETGKYFPQPEVTVADGSRNFAPPNNPNADWVLHLKAARGAATQSESGTTGN